MRKNLALKMKLATEGSSLGGDVRFNVAESTCWATVWLNFIDRGAQL